MSTPPMDHKIKRPRGPWINAASTDIAETFKRVIAEREKAAKPANVRQIKRAK